MGWFTEYYDGCGLKIKIRKKLVEHRGLQKIEIYDTETFGKMLVLDGKIQLTEFDEVFYHEMLVHVPMITHPNPESVLIVGGGDGGALREVLKHNPEKVVVAEVDRDVIELCREHIGLDRGAFEDSRVELKNVDGKEYLKSCQKFDVIIVDSTDPNPVSMSLFDEEFFSFAAEKCDVFCCQAQSPVIQKEYFKTIVKNSKSFGNRRVYVSYVPTYPLALWGFLLAGKGMDLTPEEISKRMEKRVIVTSHYTPQLHIAVFALPRWLEKEVSECI
jgi:spermidine synthase